MENNSVNLNLQSLESSEFNELQNKLIDSLPGGIIIYKIGKEIETKYFSEGILRLTGYNRSEYSKLIYGDIVLSTVFEDDQVEMAKRISEAVKTGSTISMTYRLKHKTGSLIWVQLSASMISEEADGKFYYAIFTRLAEESELYKNIADNSSTAIFIAERKSRKLIYTNKAWKKLRKIKLSENIIGHKITEYVSDVDKVYTDEELENLSSVDFKETHMLNSDGKYLAVFGKAISWCGYDAYICYVSDETELGLNKAMLDAATKTAKVLAWKYNIKTHTIVDSGTLGDFLGLPKVIENIPESFIKRGFVDKSSIQDFRNLYTELETNVTATKDICSSTTKEGKKIWQRIIYLPTYDKNGDYVESIGTAIDVTEQKERERQYEQETRLKRLLSNNAIAVAHFNISKNIITDKESFEENLNTILNLRSADEVLKNIAKNIDTQTESHAFDEINSCKKLMASFNAGKKKITVRHHLKNDERWMETIFDLIVNPYTGDLEAIAVLHDISKLVVTEQIVNTLMNIDYESIVAIDSETGKPTPFSKGHIEDVIQEQKNVGNTVLGVESYLRKYCPESDIDRIIKETSLPYVKEILKTQKVHSVTYSLLKDDAKIYKRVIYTYLDATKKTILCAMQDITQTYKHELSQKQLLENALSDAEIASHAKTDFFSRMSHDLRTPMNGILGLAELSKNETNVETLQTNISKIKESGKYLLSLINDTLDWQKIESGRLVLDERITPMNDIIENVKDIITPAASAKNISFTIINHNADFNYYVKLDAVRLKQIFINLLSNAVNFTPKGGKVIFDFTCTKRGAKKSHCCIKVIDTGCGMSKEFIQNGLYKPFSQEHDSTNANYSGTGLGLSIVKRLIQIMKGSIDVESVLGGGTTFSINLDFERVEKDTACNTNKQNEKKQISIKEKLLKKNILLVEDQPLNAEIAKALLEKMGCIVTWANNGKEAVNIFSDSKTNSFDAILMDVRMPLMNGLDATKTIRMLQRQDAASVPIIAMTANAYDEDVNNCLNAGMNEHISKPFEPAKLFETIAKFL